MRRLFWLLQISGWMLVIPLSVSMTLLVFPDWGSVLLFSVLRQVFGFVLTLGLWRFYRRWPADRFQLKRHAWKVAAACMLAAIADVLLTDWCVRAFALQELPPAIARGTLFARLAIYIAWSALYFFLRQELTRRSTELRLAQLEAANREAELQLLRAQVNPHFLFNALSTIIGEAETNPAAVAATTHAVSDYLRYSLRHGTHLAPLGEEITAMSAYLHVEQASLGAARFDWRIDATDEARAASVPTALIQPLIENALKYGLSTSPPPLRLRVAARVERGEVVVAVENSGSWVTHAPGERPRISTGIGLPNLQRRLELLCGAKASLRRVETPGAVRFELRLPAAAPRP